MPTWNNSITCVLRYSKPMFFVHSSLARPHGTRRHRGRYAGWVFNWSACSNTAGRSSWPKEDNHIIWFNLGHRIYSTKRIYCTFPLQFATCYNIYLLQSIFIFENRDMLVVGRIISGISVGLASAVIPIYQSEITAPAIRGRIISLQQWYTLQSYPETNAINLMDT